eukprot:40933_1
MASIMSRYLNGFINLNGGSIYFGIQEDGKVVGCDINLPINKIVDQLYQLLYSKLHKWKPLEYGSELRAKIKIQKIDIIKQYQQHCVIIPNNVVLVASINPIYDSQKQQIIFSNELGWTYQREGSSLTAYIDRLMKQPMPKRETTSQFNYKSVECSDGINCKYLKSNNCKYSHSHLLQNNFVQNDDNKASISDTFKIGEKVRIIGLNKQRKYNQSIGKVMCKMDNNTGRYAIKITTKVKSFKLKIKPINIRKLKKLSNEQKKKKHHFVQLKCGTFNDEEELLDILEGITDPNPTMFWMSDAIRDKYCKWKTVARANAAFAGAFDKKTEGYGFLHDDFFLTTQSEINLAATYVYGSRNPQYRVLGDCLFQDSCHESDHDCDGIHRVTLEEVASFIMMSKQNNSYIQLSELGN